MANYNCTLIRPKGFLHSSAFLEVRDSLAWSLASLGHQTVSTDNAYSASPDSTNVIFGAELLSPGATIPPNTIVYNLEQPGHPSMENLRHLVKSSGARVWDYNKSNIEDWNLNGISAQHLPIGYTPNLTRIPKATEQDIDVFFGGWMTPRRSKLIQSLRSSGLHVVATDCCYGGGRDQLISRSKVCLNVNHDGRYLFNIVRVSFLLANAKCVISELPSNIEDYARDLDGALEWHPYDKLVEACIHLAREEDGKRADLEYQALARMEKLDFTRSVDHVLNGHQPLSQVSSNPIQSRYDRGCQSGDMKDFLPLLRGLAKGQILEIGIRDGASTSAFLLGLEERGGHLTSVDIQDCSGLWTHEQWRVICADSKTCQFSDSSFDLVLVDGDHSPEGFQADIGNALRWVRPGGIILCHDISPLPNFTNESRGGDWPSEFVGEYFWKFANYAKLRAFIYPGAWGMGVIIKDPQ